MVVRLLLLLVSILGLGWLIHWVFYAPLETDSLKQNFEIVEKKESLETFQYIRYEGGVIRWILLADTANTPSPGLVDLKNPVLTYYRPQGDTLSVRANEGKWNQAGGRITLLGDVLIRHHSLTMNTESLTYEDRNKLFSSNSPVRISLLQSQLISQGLRFYPEKKEFELFKVKGKLFPEEIKSFEREK